MPWHKARGERGGRDVICSIVQMRTNKGLDVHETRRITVQYEVVGHDPLHGEISAMWSQTRPAMPWLTCELSSSHD
jgi:hypothetical protein